MRVGLMPSLEIHVLKLLRSSCAEILLRADLVPAYKPCAEGSVLCKAIYHGLYPCAVDFEILS